jgi:sigma-B regulation protein RsbU (phosphoserine phosphatase)
VTGLDYCGENRPAVEVGGDYFDFLDFLSQPSPKLGIAIGDISGKGIPAAMQMPILRTSLRALIICPQPNLAGLVTNLNRLVHEALSQNHFASFFYAEYEVPTRRLTYVNARHNSPIVLPNRTDQGEVTRLDAGGGVLGLFPETSFSQATVTLAIRRSDDRLHRWRQRGDERAGPATGRRSIDPNSGGEHRPKRLLTPWMLCWRL